MENKRYDSISFGLFLLFVGTLALLTNMNFLTWRELLDFVLRYWPLFVILAGVKIVGNAQLGKLFGFALDVIFFIAVIAGLVYAKDRLLPPITQEEMTQTTSVNFRDYADAAAVEYDINFGAADFSMTDKSSDSYLTMTGPKEFKVTPDFGNAKTLRIQTINTPIDRFYRLSTLRFPKKYTLNLGVLEVPSKIQITTGASDGTVVLDELNLDDLSTKVGAGDLTVELTYPAVPRKISGDVGAGKTSYRIHGTNKVRVNYSLGAGSLQLRSATTNLDKEFGGIGANGVYETSPEPDVTFQINIGAGNVVIELD